MKAFYSLISVSLAMTIAFTACTNNASEKAAEVNKDSTTVSTEAMPVAGGQDLEANKKLVSEFYQALMGDKDSTAIDKYIADNVIQHNPLLQDGKDWLKAGLRPFLNNPNLEKTKVDIKHIVAEGDMVWLMVREVAPNGKVFARLDGFRVANGKITENWLVFQEVPKNSENKNGMF